MTSGKNWIMICGPKDDGTNVVEFRTASDLDPEDRGARDPAFPERMPYGLFVPDVAVE